MSEEESEIDSDPDVGDIQYDPQVEEERNAELRRLLDETLKLREASERGEDCVEKATNIVQAADEYTKEAKLASTAYLDAQVLHTSSLVYKNCVEMMGTAMSEFSGDEFADMTLAFVRANDASEPSGATTMWSALEPIAQHAVNTAPGFCGQLGALDAPTVPQRRAPRKERNPEQAIGHVKKPKNVKTAAREEGNLEGRLECIMKVIWKLYKQHKQPLEFFQLIINPHSFSETVENMFHMSHLLKEKLITMHVDKRGVVTVKPVRAGQKPRAEGGQETEENQQLAMSINMALWQKFIDKLQLREPTIPPFQSE